MTFLFLSAFLIAATGMGLLTLCAFDRKRQMDLFERLPLAFVIGAFLLHLGVSGVGRIRLDALSMAALLLPFLGLGLWGLYRESWSGLIQGVRDIGTWPRSHQLLTLVLLVIGTVNLLQGMAPPNDYDSLMYHMALPKADIEEGRIVAQYKYSLVHAFFPQLTENLVRMALALAGEPAAQPVVGLIGLAAVWGSAVLVLRMGGGRFEALLAALLFLIVRAVIWEMGTAEVELPLAASTVCALLVLLHWRENPSLLLAALFGLFLGIGFNVKYPGGAVGIALGLSLLAAPGRIVPLLKHVPLIVLAGGLAILPQSLVNILETGNPVYPLFNPLFNPGAPSFFGLDDNEWFYGTGQTFKDLLLSPLLLSVQPMKHFDGMVLGAPYLIALLPLVLLARPLPRHIGIVSLGLCIYYVIWFYLLSRQVRFLIPFLPQASALAAIGAVALWVRLEARPVLRFIYLFLCLVLAVNQGLFVGIYAALRLPVAVGLKSATDFHKTPTLEGAYFMTCSYVQQHLKPGESYLSLLGPHSYYCPQKSATLVWFPDEERNWMLKGGGLPSMTRAEFLKRFAEMDFRFVILPKASESRRNDTAARVLVPAKLETTRFGPHLVPALAKLTPLMEDRFSAVYDGHQVLSEMQAQAQ
ncbi:MAG: phospholipid carrier-dependent glycosyltransferase [Rhodospirillales bacterium]|nr:MAG: phospholipid carrier-dependent glycosyltransferase [Rhodospirillales bacterium]